jgi:hypothetical protein
LRDASPVVPNEEQNRMGLLARRWQDRQNGYAMRDRRPVGVYMKSTAELAAEQRAHTLHRLYGDPIASLPTEADGTGGDQSHADE